MTDLAPDPVMETRPAHYRLSTEVWEIILGEYRAGATAPFLSLKWRVSEHALRRRITRHAATKRDWGDEQAMKQARGRAAAMEAAQASAWAASPEARAARLFEPESDEDPDAGDPAALMRVATLASGRAMRGRLWAEARALASLAESYRRLTAGEAARAAGDWRGGYVDDEAEGAMRDALRARLEVLAAQIEARTAAEAEAGEIEASGARATSPRAAWS